MQSQGANKSEVQVHTPDLAKEKKNQLTVTFFVGGKQVDKLSPEQSEKLAQRMAKSLSLYYSNHLDEYQKIKK